MLKKSILIEGIEYKRMKIFNGEKAIYVEYRNEDTKKIKFFQIRNESLIRIEDKEDLREAVKNHYFIDSVYDNLEE